MPKSTFKNRVETIISSGTASRKIKIMLDKAVDFLANTKDPTHGMDHVNKLLKDTNRFLQSMKKKVDIDKETMLLSLYWHDVWKSQNTPRIRNHLFYHLYEGLGSMFMFKKYAKSVELSPQITRSVSYVIRKHSAIQFLPAKTLEAQLLWDIDTLDLWNPQRMQTIFQTLEPANIFIFDSFILYMKKVSFHLNFDWTKNEVERIRPSFFREMSLFRESLVK